MKKCIINVGIASATWSYAPRDEVLLDDDLAAAWQECGHCTIVEDVPEPEVVNATEEVVNSIESLGGGWYQVPDGNKFKGKSAAEEYLMNGGASNAVDNSGDNAPQQTDAAGSGVADIGDGEAAS